MAKEYQTESKKATWEPRIVSADHADREPPNDPDAERHVLGAMLLNPDVVQPVVDVIGNDSLCFYVPAHQTIYAAVLELLADSRPVDAVTLMSVLGDAGDLDMVGGASYLAGLTLDVPTSANGPYYAQIVMEKFTLRQTAEIGRRVAEQALSGGAHAADVLGYVEQSLSTLLGTHDGDSWPKPTDTSLWPFEDPPDLDFLFKDILPTGVIAGLDAAGGSGKGYFVQQLIFSACLGRPLLTSFEPVAPMRVLWLESEDPPTEIHRRMGKIADAFDISAADYMRARENLRLFAGVRFPLVEPCNGTVIKTKYYRRLEAEVKAFQPRLIVIDPRSHFFGGDENSNVEVAAFMGYLADLTKHVEGGAAIWVNHHTSKERESEPSSAAGRGASAGRDAQRVLFSLNGLTDAERRSIGATNPGLYAKLTHTKSNWVAQRTGAIFLQRDPASTPTGGVLREIDAEARAREVADAVAGHMGKAIAEWIGDNPDGLSVTDLWNRPKGKLFRESLRNTFGNRATCDAIRDAISEAINSGILYLERVPTSNGNKPREIPKSMSIKDLQKVAGS